jgi:hypothetical protein
MKYLYLTIFLCFAIKLSAQIGQPELNWVFDDSSVSRIDIIIDQDSLDQLLLEENWFLDHEYPSTMLFTKNDIVDTVYNVGLRLRGNTSREAAKKSFKISVNSFVSGQKYKGLKKLNLNGEHNDPSIMRSKLNWDLLRNNELPSTRVSFTDFYINDVNKGLYIIVEHINDDFLELRYGNSEGNLYKCLWPANLQYISSNPEDYKLESYGRRVYELKNNLDTDDYSDIANFINVLNNTPINDLYCELSKVFDVEDYLEILATDILTGNWDGYAFNKNNFYLYHNPETDRFQYIPYDLDNTLGIDWFGEDWTQKNIYNWSPGWDYLPLYERLMENEEMKNIFSFFVNDIRAQFSGDSLNNAIDSFRDLIAPSAELDTFRIMDYGFTYDDFWNSFDQNIPYGHVDSGLKPFYEDRSASAEDQLDLVNIAPIVRYIQVHPALTQLPISIKAFVEDEDSQVEVWALYTMNSVLDSVLLFDDGLHGDEEAQDGWFANVIGSFDEMGFLDIQIKASDLSQNLRIAPCEALQYLLEMGSPIVINEFMAKNDSTIQDNVGNYSDWIELYNNSNESVNLNGYYLSDDLSNKTKWAIPDISIEANGFYLVWCTSDSSLGENHSNFKLSADGEDVALSYVNNNDTILLDGFSYGVQTSDTSYGRQTDANPNWVYFEYPTPNSSNGVLPLTINDIETNDQDLLSLYPNPYRDKTNFTNFDDEKMEISIYNVNGQLLEKLYLQAGESRDYFDPFSGAVKIVEAKTVDKGSIILRMIKVD